MEVLREYHGELGRLVMEHGGAIHTFTGDGMMIVFNDPVEVPDPEERAVRMAVAIREAGSEMRQRWDRQGYDLDQGIGITTGYATLGLIGFEGRWDYSAFGSVTNQAARLCAAAANGQILVSDRFLSAVEGIVEAEPVGELSFKGLRRPLATHNVLRLKAS